MMLINDIFFSVLCTLFCIKFFFASYSTGPLFGDITGIAFDLCLVKALTPSISECSEETTIKFRDRKSVV